MSREPRDFLRRLLRSFTYEPDYISPECLSELRSRLTSEPEIRRLILENKKIQAIKELRGETGVTLRESKVVVDEMEQEFLEGSRHASSPER